MNNKERIKRIFDYEPVDRLPAVHFGYWQELIDEWIEEGRLSPELRGAVHDDSEECHELDKLLGWDFDWQSMAAGNTMLNPVFETEILERGADGFVTYRNAVGVIERVKDGAHGIPSEIDYTLKDRDAFEKLYKSKMRFDESRIPYEYFNTLNDKPRDYPIGLHLGSVLGSIRDMLSLTGMSYLMCDDFDLFKEIIDTYADMQFKCAEAVLKTGAKFDFAHYWEDICFKNGPLISPQMFRELCFEHYRKRNELCKSYGIKVISLDCDGVIGSLAPIWYESGVNAMFPLEIGVWGDQFEALRAKFGKGMFGVGSVDKTVLRKDRAAVDEELKRVQKLVDLGGYLPCPDHRLMPGTKWDLVRYYTEKIKKLKPYGA